MAKQNKNITFTPRLVDKVGRISDVLAEFLEEQVARIQNEVKGLPDQAVQQLLAQFVTEEGTKKPIARAAIEGELTKKQLDAILSRLEDARILKQDEPGVYELAHDTLAQRIIDALDAEELEIRRAVRIVRDRYTVFEDTETYLEPREVQLVEVHEKALKERLSAEEWAYLIRSRSYNKKQRRKWAAVAIGTIIILSFLSAFSAISWLIADNEKENALKNLRLALNAKAILEFDMKGDATKGFQFAQTARERTDSKDSGQAAPFESEQILYSMIFQDPAQYQKLFYRMAAQNSDTTQWQWLALSSDGQKTVAASPDSVLFITGKQESPSQPDTIRLSEKNVEWAAFSSDGNTIATGSRDTVAVWNSRGELLYELSSGGESMVDGQFSPDGAHLLARVTNKEGGGLKAALLWKDAKEGVPFVYIISGYPLIRWLGFSANSTLVMAAMEDTTIVVIEDIEDNRPALVLSGHTAPANFAATSPSGNAIITASEDHTAIVWNTSGTIMHTLAQHTGPVNWAGFSPDGKYILTTSDDKTAILWNRQEMKPEQKFTQHTAPVRWAAFSSGGDSILTASEGGTALLWRPDGTVLAQLNGHEGAITWAGFTPDGKNILTRGKDKTVRAWFSAQPESRAIARLGKPARAAIPGGENDNRALIITADGTAKLWSRSIDTLANLLPEDKKISKALFSPDGRQILSLPADPVALLWGPQKNIISLKGHVGVINDAAFSPSGDMILTASSDWTARLWGLDGTELMALKPDSSHVRAVQCSEDGKTILAVVQKVIPVENNKSRLGNRKALLWSLDDNPTLTPTLLETGNTSVLFAAFYPGKERVITTTDDNTIRLWNLEGKCMDTLRSHSATVNGICFDSKGGFLSYSGDRTAIYWDDKRSIKERLAGHEQPVIAAEFSPEGDTILTLSDDGVLKLWNDNGKLQYTLKNPNLKITSAHFMKYEGHLNILATYDDGTVRLVPADLEFIVDELSAQLGELDDATKRNWGLLQEEESWFEKGLRYLEDIYKKLAGK